MERWKAETLFVTPNGKRLYCAEKADHHHQLQRRYSAVLQLAGALSDTPIKGQ